MIAEALGAFVSKLDPKSLSEEVTNAIKLRVLDTLGVGIAGAQLGLSRPVIGLFESATKAAQSLRWRMKRAHQSHLSNRCHSRSSNSGPAIAV